MQGDAPFGERERLFVLVLHQRDVCLVVHDPREDVVGRNRHRKAFSLTERSRRLVIPARLREQHRRQRMHEREMTTVSHGVQRRRGLGQVLADNARVANLLVAEGKFVVGQSDGS